MGFVLFILQRLILILMPKKVRGLYRPVLRELVRSGRAGLHPVENKSVIISKDGSVLRNKKLTYMRKV